MTRIKPQTCLKPAIERWQKLHGEVPLPSESIATGALGERRERKWGKFVLADEFQVVPERDIANATDAAVELDEIIDTAFNPVDMAIAREEAETDAIPLTWARILAELPVDCDDDIYREIKDRAEVEAAEATVDSHRYGEYLRLVAAEDMNCIRGNSRTRNYILVWKPYPQGHPLCRVRVASTDMPSFISGESPPNSPLPINPSCERGYDFSRPHETVRLGGEWGRRMGFEVNRGCISDQSIADAIRQRWIDKMSRLVELALTIDSEADYLAACGS